MTKYSEQVVVSETRRKTTEIRDTFFGIGQGASENVGRKRSGRIELTRPSLIQIAPDKTNV
jgi:hypothetical protein